MSEIQIKPIGSFFEVDQDDYLINPTSLEKIQEKYKPVIDDIVKAYKTEYKDTLICVYVRGSVAKGQAVDGVSDIDTFAYVSLPKNKIKYEWVDITEAKLTKKYPFLLEIEMGASSREESETKSDQIILNQSVCVWGNPITVPRLKVGKNLALHAPNFQKRIDGFGRFLELDENDEETKKRCVWLMKGLLRVGAELTFERSKKYTRDLYKCYEVFSEYYPEQEPAMKEALYLALNPTTDKKKLATIMNTLGNWILEETKKIDWND